MNEKIIRAAGHFFENEKIVSIAPFGSGHINRTFLLVVKEAGEEKKYIFQKINSCIFKDVHGLMENIEYVTNYLREIILKQGGDPDRETMTVVPTMTGEPYYRDEDASYYRVYKYITGALTYDKVETVRDFYESAVSFGNFQRLLADFPAETLHETIPHFHDTFVRYGTFEQSVQKDIKGRAEEAAAEIAFVRERKELIERLGKAQQAGELPLRVTHNDTKLNNIMIDEETRRGICVIDLDTVMPGLAVNDFGDSIRFGANTALEDETDLSKVSCDIELFEAYVKGFFEGLQGSLTQKEEEMLLTGAMAMTLECGMRFLTDYLDGDTYFAIHREKHNLDRARNQFALLRDMERKEAELDYIVKKYTNDKN